MTGLLISGVLLSPQIGLVYDNLIVGAGQFIGFSPLLETISWPRFWIHWLFGTWLIVASGVALRLAGFEFMRGARPMLVFCSLTMALMMYDLPHFWNDTLYPVCEFDLIRYSTAVSADTLCFEGQEVVRSSPPVPSIITCFVVIGSGGLLMVKRKFPLMFLGGVLMLASAMPPLRNFKMDNFGEILIAGGCIWALAHFARDRNENRLAHSSDALS
ncbi:MAG: hypothetical protein FJ178_04100 [Gammaproteobacteria bacterium]|nr:hypothetical protein [Gammaproteobacteria bacterium]